MGLRNFFKFDKTKIIVFLSLCGLVLFWMYFKQILPDFVNFPIGIPYLLFMLPIGVVFLILNMYVPLDKGDFLRGSDPTPLGQAVLFILQILYVL